MGGFASFDRAKPVGERRSPKPCPAIDRCTEVCESSGGRGMSRAGMTQNLGLCRG